MELVYDPTEFPQMIKPVPRFHTCLQALADLFEQEFAPKVMVRSSRVYLLLYEFADASGSGFGSTFLTEEGVHFRIGT